MDNHLGLSHFLHHIDHVGMSVAILLLSLSLASWYLIITKSIRNAIATRHANIFLKRFWNADSLQALKIEMKDVSTDNVFGHLAKLAFEVENSLQKPGLRAHAITGGADELLTRTLRNGIDQEATRIENGLTLIATAGSAAPYIGLFGTVWGIYHALIQIGLSGQGTLDKVAGPVGEALIMTALGLAVAIPSVLAYNAFIRRNRLWMAKLDAFAHDLYTIITVGNKTGDGTIMVAAESQNPQPKNPAGTSPALEGER
ncbi:MAG: MotA/TolQ/ExbB proton channel family protein [Nitrosomonas sp.]|uniref:MotA/TolQ/ExbB proton channel family protein n=1 Tax=Nitrosomonas sp. TaxID=42353 RepID=UPI0032EB7CB7